MKETLEEQLRYNLKALGIPTNELDFATEEILGVFKDKISEAVEECKGVAKHYKEAAIRAHKDWNLDQARFCMNQYYFGRDHCYRLMTLIDEHYEWQDEDEEQCKQSEN